MPVLNWVNYSFNTFKYHKWTLLNQVFLWRHSSGRSEEVWQDTCRSDIPIQQPPYKNKANLQQSVHLRSEAACAGERSRVPSLGFICPPATWQFVIQKHLQSLVKHKLIWSQTFPRSRPHTDTLWTLSLLTWVWGHAMPWNKQQITAVKLWGVHRQLSKTTWLNYDGQHLVVICLHPLYQWSVTKLESVYCFLHEGKRHSETKRGHLTTFLVGSLN